MELTTKDIGLKGGSEESASAESADVQKWVKEVEGARKREKDFRKEGTRIVALYEGEKRQEFQFNILYSNTETMLPALYNSTPRPVVGRRFKDEDPLGKMACKAAERTLEFLMDDGNATYTSFDELLKSATLEALLPGRGVTRFKYDATIEEGQVTYETVCGEEVPWDRFFHGSAKKWKDVPWVCFEHFMTKEELTKNFPEVGAQVEVIEMTSDDGDGYEGNPEKETSKKDTAGLKVAQVYEIWDKDSKEIYFISPQYKNGLLKKVPDPLKLAGFFPMPRPMTFIAKVSTLTPVALYTMYEEQAKELNRITVRINKLIAALKVRGLYDSTVEGIDKVLRAEDNVLVPAENVAAMLANGNALEKAIWLMPIEKLVAVLQQLYLQRTQVKGVIYEITGIADIMRGSSQASETLGAQQIKNQWGTLRLKKTQKEVMRYARDCLRLMTEIAVTKLSPETLKSMTGLPYPTGMEKQQAQAQAQQLQEQAMMAAQQAQAMGQQPQPPQIPPQLQQTLSMPSWDDLLAMLRDDTQRNYRIDIETNSTVDAEATEDKEDIGEILNAISQFLAGVGPLVENGSMPFEVAQGMLLAVVRRYRFGPELEDELKKMKEPEKGPDPAEVKKQQAELQKQSEAVAAEKQQVQEMVQQERMKLDADRREFELEQEMAKRELDFEKKMAIKELQMLKTQQTKELQLDADFAKQSLDQNTQFRETSLGEKEKQLGERESEVGEKAEAIEPATMMAPLVEALTQGFMMMGQQLQDGLVAAARTQKKAVRGTDGSWSTQTVEG